MHIHRILFLVISLALTGASVSAQQWCTDHVDDGLRNGSCCDPVMPNIPHFPEKSIGGSWACFTNCVPAETPISITLGTPILEPGECDIYRISIQAGAGLPLVCLTSNLWAKYSRTWVDVGPNGENQVWRFLVNGDAYFDNTNPDPCQLPPSASHFGLVHFHGHIDYACCPDQPDGFSVSISLTHGPGCISHGPGGRALAAGHPARRDDIFYVLVGPAPFMFTSAIATPQGTLANEAVRSTDFSQVPHVCLSELDVTDGALEVTGAPHCQCIAGNPIWCDFNLGGCAYCPGTGQMSPFMTVPARHPALPTGMTGVKVGHYCDNACYPWNQELTVYWADMDWQDLCVSWDVEHLVTGVGTSHHQGIIFKDGSRHCCFVDLQDAPRIPDLLVQDFTVPFMARVVWNLNPMCAD